VSLVDVSLPEAERDAWLETIAGQIVGRRLEVPAILALEMHRPLMFLSSQALVVAVPFLGALVGPRNVLKCSRLLEDRANLDRLLNRIEELATARDGRDAPAQEASDE